MYINRKTFNKLSGILAANLLAAMSLTGCSSAETDNDNIVIVEQETEGIEYTLGVASIDDVVKSQKVSCVYTQLNSQKVSFALSGKLIAKVYVKEGDKVEKGQLLAELSSGTREDEIERLEYQIARNKLLLKQAEENENFEISTRWLGYLYQTGQSEQDKKNLDSGIENLQRNYRYTKEDCEDAIALDEKQLAKLQKEAKQSSVYASMDGTVMDLKENLEGSTSTRDEVVMTIMDNAECLFAVEDTQYADYFSPGQEVDMSISYGTGSGQYKLEPYDMENWEEALLFVITEGGDNAVIEPGTSGTITVITQQRSQVLSLPLAAVHDADGEQYVYIVGEDNMREVKWIETGLAGDEKIEVTAGLSEGEKVILK